MSGTRSNLIFLSIGLALGAAVGYVLASDKVKKEEWLKSATDLVGRVKGAVCKEKENCEDILEENGGDQ